MGDMADMVNDDTPPDYTPEQERFADVNARLASHFDDLHAEIERLRAGLNAVVYVDEGGVLCIKGEAKGNRDHGQFRAPWKTGRFNKERVITALHAEE